MDDLRELLREVDRVGLPEQWQEIQRRAEEQPAQPEAPARPIRRVIAAGVALTTFAVAAVFAWRAFLGDPGEPIPPVRPATTEPSPTASPSATKTPSPGMDPFADLPTGWTELAGPPEVHTSAATAWTGTKLLVWGGFLFTASGNKPDFASGLAYDAASDTWSEMAPSPLSPRSSPAFAWTGSELLVWGGYEDDYATGAPIFLGDGAAYDPASDAWRSLPPAPIGARDPLSVWTGRELIVWGTESRVGDRPLDGAAYDPATDAWRRIADGPIELTDATAVWTGAEMIVFGAALHGGNFPETETAIGAAYDPSTDTWRRIPDSELSPQASTAAWNGREMIAWDYLNGTAAYDPSGDSWRSLQRVPLDDAECIPESVAIGRRVFGNYCGLLALYDPSPDAWRALQPDLVKGYYTVIAAAAGDVVLLFADMVPRLDDEPVLLAYRPER